MFNYQTILTALEWLRKYKHLYLEMLGCECNANIPAPFESTTFKPITKVEHNPLLHLEIKFTIPLGQDYVKYLTCTYVFPLTELNDEAEVNKIIGKDIERYNDEAKTTLRLAYIIFNGYRYAHDHISHIDFPSRVVSYTETTERADLCNVY